MEHILDISDSTERGRQLATLRTKIESEFKMQWEIKRVNILNNDESKLHLSAQLCTNFERTAYIVKLENQNIGNAVCRFRLSSHNLPIETLRFLNTPRSMRICPLCCNDIGDELHYMLNCTYHKLSDSIAGIHAITAPYMDFSPSQKLLNLLNDTNPGIMRKVGRHIKLVQDLFRDSFSFIDE